MKRFGVMLDMSRNAVMKPEEIKNFAKIIKSFGYNMIQLYTEDTYEVENEPYFGYLRGRYMTEELKDVVSYCNGIGVEVIPCIQTLAHLNQIFKWSTYHSVNDCTDILLAEEPRTYELIENMFKSLRKSFTTDYIHIGMDEAHMLGLGKYLDKHGYQNRFEILSRHLSKVIEIAEKYAFKPIMWSDMFFGLANKGEYYPENPAIPQEVIDITPKNVGLVYWDYYHHEQAIYDKMFDAHLEFGNEVWFAGGAWTWAGFASGNKKSMETMIPAMRSAKGKNIENILITMWGDDGKECSFYAVLPALYAMKRVYDGVEDMETIKGEFKTLTGEDYDAMSNLDLPNYVLNNRTCLGNVSKHMLYSDPFLGFLDTTVDEKAAKEFAMHAKTLASYAETSKNYGYIFETLSALCSVLAVKYPLGVRLRAAYQANDKKSLEKLSEDFSIAIERLDVFHDKFSTLWYKENKPHGFEVQDQRLGGLRQRLVSCKKRLDAYLGGFISKLPELEEELLDFYCRDTIEPKDELPCFNMWKENVSTSIM